MLGRCDRTPPAQHCHVSSSLAYEILSSGFPSQQGARTACPACRKLSGRAGTRCGDTGD